MSKEKEFHDYKVSHDFPNIGKRVMLLNGIQERKKGRDAGLTLLAISDITEREQLTEKANELNNRYRTLFTQARDAIMTLEPPLWRFTSGNPEAIKMFRVKDEAEFISCEPWKLSSETQPDGRPSVEKSKEMIEKALREGFNFFEWVHKRADGEEFAAEMMLSRVKIGEKTFLYADVRDITERKTREEKAKEVTESLEKMNSFMTGRELKMVELKAEIASLRKAASEMLPK